MHHGPQSLFTIYFYVMKLKYFAVFIATIMHCVADMTINRKAMQLTGSLVAQYELFTVSQNVCSVDLHHSPRMKGT